MASNKTQAGGYDCKWVEEPLDELKCLNCLCVARDPYQHPGDPDNKCGKIFCHGCITEYQKIKQNCPNCRRKSTLFQDTRSKPATCSTYIQFRCAWPIRFIYYHILGARNIRALKVKCSNLDNGCQWTGELGELETHLQSCDYALLPCTNECKNNDQIVKVLREDLRNHLTNKCPRRQYKCPHCEEMGEHQERTTSHLQTCPQVKVRSNAQCEASIPRCEVSTHRPTCDYEPVSCKYAEVGVRRDLYVKTSRNMRKTLNFTFK